MLQAPLHTDYVFLGLFRELEKRAGSNSLYILFLFRVNCAICGVCSALDERDSWYTWVLGSKRADSRILPQCGSAGYGITPRSYARPAGLPSIGFAINFEENNYSYRAALLFPTLPAQSQLHRRPTTGGYHSISGYAPSRQPVIRGSSNTCCQISSGPSPAPCPASL